MTRSVEEALAYAKAESERRSQDWAAYCQRFVRSCYGIEPLFASAWAQWLGADPEDRNPGIDPGEAPVGAALCYRGGAYGHIMLAARDRDGVPMAWSNDLVRRGQIDYVPRSAPVTTWGQTYVGWLSAVNDVDLPLGLAPDAPPKRPKPRRYESIRRAILRLEAARDTAAARGDAADVRLIKHELRRLRLLYREAVKE